MNIWEDIQATIAQEKAEHPGQVRCENCGDWIPEGDVVPYGNSWKLCPVCAADWARLDAQREENIKLGYLLVDDCGPACDLCGKTDTMRALTPDNHVLCVEGCAEECGYYQCDDDGRYVRRLRLRHKRTEKGFSRLVYISKHRSDET